MEASSLQKNVTHTHTQRDLSEKCDHANNTLSVGFAECVCVCVCGSHLSHCINEVKAVRAKHHQDGGEAHEM